MYISETLRGGLLLAAVLLLTLMIPGATARPGAIAAAPPPPKPAKPLPRPKAPPPPLAAQDRPGARPAAPLRTGGPDAYGYLVSDNNDPRGPLFDYKTATHQATEFADTDDYTTTVALPFPITIYERTTTTITLAANGLLFIPQLFCNESRSGCFANQSLPSTDAPPALIAPLWDDLTIPAATDGGIYTDVLGTTPNRIYVVEWRNVGFYEHPADVANFEVLFHENSNQVDFQYGDLTGPAASGLYATVGIQSYAQAAGLMYSFEESALVANRAVRFLALVTPGNQVVNTTGCADVSYYGQIVNPSTARTTFNIGLANSNPQFSTVITPSGSVVISPGLSVPFTVTVNVPDNVLIGAHTVTTLTVANSNNTLPPSEMVILATNIASTGAIFGPDTADKAGTAGTPVTFTTTLYNQTGTTTRFDLAAGGNTWPVTISPNPTGNVAPSEGVSVTVRVTIPSASQVGESDAVVITATARTTAGCAYFALAQFTTFNGDQVDRTVLPAPRARHALVDFPANGRVYMIGGVTTHNDMNLPIEEYDSRADTWTARTPLLHNVNNVGGVALGDKIYIPGGFDGISAVDLVQTYQPTTDLADLLTSDPLPVPRYGAGVVGLGGKMYVIGGAVYLTTTDVVTNTVLEFDPGRPAGARWAYRASMPTRRVFLGVSVLDGQIYAVGGISDLNNLGDLATLEIYDPAGDRWTSGPAMSTARGGPAVVGRDTGTPCGGYLYVFGGGWFNPLATAERYSPVAASWSTWSPLNVARRSLAASYASNSHMILITGGYNGIEIPNVDAVLCGGTLPTPTPTPPGGVPTPTPGPCERGFSDVQSTDYFYTPVRYLVCHQAVSGYTDGTFRPFNNMTRGQLSKMVVLAEGWALDTRGGPHFSDVPADNPFYAYIETAFHHEIVNGYGEGTFRLGNNVTRSQIAKIIVQAEGWSHFAPDMGHFSDVPPGSPFYEFVETAYAHAILSGYGDGTFRPFASATRGQVSKILYIAIHGP